MSRRVTITIPDGLHDRLQVVKGSFSVSGVCQGALESAISYAEIDLKEIPGMEKLVERLRSQKESEADQWRKDGAEQGRQDAVDLDLADFRLLAEARVQQSWGEEIVLTQDFYNSEMCSNIRESFYHFDEKPDEEPYMEGWVEGALEVWDEVKDQV